MLTKIKKVGRSRFVRNVIVVATGTAGAQAIAMVFAPIITRQYGPEAFGILGTFTAVLAILTPLAAFSYPFAIVLPKRDSDAIGLMKLSLGIALITSLLAALICLAFKKPIINTLSLKPIEPYILLLPIAMFFSACMAIINQWVIRKKLFKVTARVAVLQALWLNSAKAGVGAFLPAASVLVVFAALSSALHGVMLWLSVLKGRTGNAWPNEAPSSSFKKIAFQYRDFFYYRTPQVALNSAAQSMPVLMLANLFGPTAAGYYSLSFMVLLMPIALIGNAVGDVFYPKIAEAFNSQEKIFNSIIKATLALLSLGIIPFGIIFFFGPFLFSLAFGKDWFTAGEYASWLSIWLLFMMADQPSVKALPILSSQRFYLGYTCFTIVLRALALFFGSTYLESDVYAIAIFSIVSMILNIILILTILQICLKHDRALR